MLAQGRDGLDNVVYERHQPEQTLLYQIIEAHYPALVDHLTRMGKSLPGHVHREFEAYLKCGCLEHGFLRVRCDKCHLERLVAFSCKKRGFCPSCGARRMAETAALLADEVFPDVPLRQWVISFPFPLRYLFAAHPQAMGKVLGIVYRAISSVAVGPQQGRKAFMVRTLRPSDRPDPRQERVAKANGFSLPQGTLS